MPLPHGWVSRIKVAARSAGAHGRRGATALQAGAAGLTGRCAAEEMPRGAFGIAACLLFGYCLNDARTLSRCCQELVSIIFGCCLDFISALVECHPGVAWMLFGCCLDSVWMCSDGCCDVSKNSFGICFWMPFLRCLDVVRMLSGRGLAMGLDGLGNAGGLQHTIQTNTIRFGIHLALPNIRPRAP